MGQALARSARTIERALERIERNAQAQSRLINDLLDLARSDAGKLPCPVMIIPGSLTDERLEQLS